MDMWAPAYALFVLFVRWSRTLHDWCRDFLFGQVATLQECSNVPGPRTIDHSVRHMEPCLA